MNIPERLAQLRRHMARNQLAAYVIPSTDPHQSEYVAATWQRRSFISGFDGSAGLVVVTRDEAGLWTDSRYFLQAQQQLAGSGIDLFRIGEPGVPEWESWLAQTLASGDQVGLDANVFSIAAHDRLKQQLDGAGIALVGVTDDLVEQVWGADRPPMPDGELRVHDIQYSGQSVEDKLAVLGERIHDQGAHAVVLGALDEIAWLFNLRGADVPYNPVFVSFAVIETAGARLFLDMAKVSTEVREVLPANVILQPYESLDDYLAALGDSGATVWLDPGTVNQHVRSRLEQVGARVLLRTGAIPVWKAAKNAAEINGMAASHLRDGVSMVRFLRWLYAAVLQGNETELTVWDKLREFRAAHDEFIGLSFNSIVGFGPHGAIVHYAVSDESNVPVTADNLLLVDSGGQYVDGTTDITRTVALGAPTAEQRKAYTAVLKGHLHLGRSRFPQGTDGYQLDVLARSPLWAAGLNYGHGTGHGVGAGLCVHEGPFSVSPRKVLVPLAPGNILSNEPGYYQTDSFGIRIENLVLTVVKQETESGTFLGFEELTLCPYDRNLIDLALLDAVEKAQVDTYHQKVHDALSPFLDGEDLAWLEQATRPL